MNHNCCCDSCSEDRNKNCDHGVIRRLISQILNSSVHALQSLWDSAWNGVDVPCYKSEV